MRCIPCSGPEHDTVEKTAMIRICCGLQNIWDERNCSAQNGNCSQLSPIESSTWIELPLQKLFRSVYCDSDGHSNDEVLFS